MMFMMFDGVSFAWNKTVKFAINVAVIYCSTLLTDWIYSYYYQDQSEVIFFHGQQPNCLFHRASITKAPLQPDDSNECSMCKLSRVIGWLNKAKKTLDICMYSINQDSLSQAIYDAHQRGVYVRLITDTDNDQTWKFGSTGIAKKTKPMKYNEKLMHHKFIIIDGKKIILGSLNWTIMAVRKNYENIFISNNHQLINPYKQEFQKLWRDFDL